MKRIIIILVTCISSLLVKAQLNNIAVLYSFQHENFQQINIPVISKQKSDTDFENFKKLHPDAVGYPIHVDINFFEAAASVLIPDSGKLWLLKFETKGAEEIDISFEKFYLPEGAFLVGYNENKTRVLDVLTKENNPPLSANGRKGISIRGDNLIIEYFEPNNVEESCMLYIDRIVHTYRNIINDFNTNSKGYGGSNCGIDINCVASLVPEVERSVVKWWYYDTKAEEGRICSGALLVQSVSANELRPYILTANHCGDDAELATARFYFNYQKPYCGYTGSVDQTEFKMTGATFRAKRSGINGDMFLMELNESIPPDFNVHYAGWSRDKTSASSYGIHHPDGDAKKYSAGVRVPIPNFFTVVWFIEAVEGGSSGSPLFDMSTNRVVGQLSWGTTDCSAEAQYGKFSANWDGSKSSKRTKDWLDPNDNDPYAAYGTDPCFKNLVVKNRIFKSAQKYYQPSNAVTVQASNSITTSGNVIIKNDADYTFRAGKSIVLKPGFHAEKGSNFHAKIGSCTRIAQGGSKGGGKGGNYKNDSIYDVIMKMFEEEALLDKYEFLNTERKKLVLNIYPNPNQGSFALELSGNTDELMNIEIKNILGELVYRKENIKDKRFNIDISNKPKGIYFIKAFIGDNVFVEKIVCQ